MGKVKSIKDLVHGYIQLEYEYWNIIDTAEFQRLKWIEQISFRALYPSARHDRFIHSIGTFHLGKLAFEGFINNAIITLGEDFNMYYTQEELLNLKSSFLSACLLHDVGHAPFSHTYEDLFNYKDKIRNDKCKLNKLLFSELKSNKLVSEKEVEQFINDYKYIIVSESSKTCKPPSAHEVVSSILVLKNSEKFFSSFSNKPDLILIIRAILGCVYAINPNVDNNDRVIRCGIKNCMIRLLNSKTVDVDKLDYIVRDSKMSGYENTQVDNIRLLKSLTVVSVDDVLFPAFKKSALSVLDNVIKAKNAQAKWIISHPIVQYEAYLMLKCILVAAHEYIHKNSEKSEFNTSDELIEALFSIESLSEEGKRIDHEIYRLLSDMDIIAFIKNCYGNNIIEEFFNRSKRYKPVWKSHEEFVFLFGKDFAKSVADFFIPIISNNELTEMSKSIIVDEGTFYKINREDYYGAQEVEKVLNVLKRVSEENSIQFSYIFIPVKSNFSTKIDADTTYIQFKDDKDSYTKYSNILNSLSNEAEPQNKYEYVFFYLYSKEKVDKYEFANQLKRHIKENSIYRP